MPSHNPFCATILALVTWYTNVQSLAIRNAPWPTSTPSPLSSTSYSSYSHSLSSQSTASPSSNRSPSMYPNSFADPTSLTSFFSPDRYSHLTNILDTSYGGIKLFPPLLTNHFHQKYPVTKNPNLGSFASPTPYPDPMVTPTRFPSSASFESMDSSPVIVRPKKPTRRPPFSTSSLYEASSSAHPISTSYPSPPTSFPNQHQSRPQSSTSSPSADGDTPGNLGLLYVFSEATKRLPVAEFPKRMEAYGNDFMVWGEDTVKGFEKQAVSMGDTLVEFLQTAAKDVTIKAGELISTGIDTLERSMKSYLSDWIGCAKPKG